MMRILVVSDIHGSLGRVKRLASIKRELTVVAGDISRCGSIEEAKAVLGELARQSPVAWIPGNCDSPELVRVSIANAECIHMKAYRFKELVLAGVGGSIHTPFGTPFEYSEEEYSGMLAELKEEIKKNSDSGRVVLVSHTPPHMSGLDRVRGGAYVGSPSLRKLIAETRPLLVATGHIHEAWGVASVEGVLAVNPGPLEAGKYAIVDIDPAENMVRVRLARLTENSAADEL